MFGKDARQQNPIAQAIANNMTDTPQKTRYDEGVDLYWGEHKCPQDPEGMRGWEVAMREVELGISDE